MAMQPLSRRTLLRGLGVSLALPWLEAMGPLNAWADDSKKPKGGPNRLAFIYVPNGKNMADWTPAKEGADFELPAILEPLKDVRGEFSILTGLTADKARSHGDGGGDHARACAAYLTGAQPRKTDGTDIRSGISARSGRRVAHGRRHAPGIVGNRLRQGIHGRRLRQRLQLRVQLEHVLEIRHAAESERSQSEDRIRTHVHHRLRWSARSRRSAAEELARSCSRRCQGFERKAGCGRQAQTG